jgi:hypothetical protein
MAKLPDLQPPVPAATARFADALRSAIQASGLSLNRIEHRLRERGQPVSSATLSYWQSGLRQPGRHDSLLVVRALEEVLRLREGSLAALLQPVTTRRRRRPYPGARFEALWDDAATAAAVQAHKRSGWDADLVRLSQHDRCEVGPDRRIRRTWHRQVLRADTDGPDRWVVVVRDPPGEPPPQMGALSRCRLGALVHERDTRLLVAELMFDRALSRGDTVVFEYELRYARHGVHSRDGDRYVRKCRYPVREHVVEVVFSPAAVPARCEWYAAPAGAPERVHELPLSSPYAHAVGIDVPPGRYGIRWFWPET